MRLPAGRYRTPLSRVPTSLRAPRVNVIRLGDKFCNLSSGIATESWRKRPREIAHPPADRVHASDPLSRKANSRLCFRIERIPIIATNDPRLTRYLI